MPLSNDAAIPGGALLDSHSVSDIASVDVQWFDKGRVAALTRKQIDSLDNAALVRLIRAARIPLIRADVDRKLPLQDRETLRRLAYMARRCCRNQGY